MTHNRKVFFFGVAAASFAVFVSDVAVGACRLPEHPTSGELHDIYRISGSLPLQCMARVQGIDEKTKNALSVRESQCGPTVELDHIRFFPGRDGFSADFARRLGRSVAMLRPVANSILKVGTNAANVKPVGNGGDCTATLIGADLILTAGHCIDTTVNGTTSYVIGKNGAIREAKPSEIATETEAVFDYELSEGCDCVAERVYRVKEVVAFRSGNSKLRAGESIPTEFAILRLTPDEEGKLPDADIPIVPIAARSVAAKEPIAIIQHPNGALKHIGVGARLPTKDDSFLYDTVDTSGGTSGAAILSKAGEIVGLHVLRGCEISGSGSNKAVPVERLLAEESFRKGIGR